MSFFNHIGEDPGQGESGLLDERAKHTGSEFQPTVDSLLDYECPKWFREAKFGIYLHWGVYSVPAYGEWYPRQMYVEGDSAYEHHLKTYGHQSKFGYKDFIPSWKAERFDPDGLVALFKRAGAKYFTPCAVHHDNFDLWNSKHHKWNSVNMGPKIDITGMWRESTLKHGLRFGVTTHLERSYSWFNVNKGSDKFGPYKGIPYDGNDKRYQDFYFTPSDDTSPCHPLNPPESWRRNWALRMKDLIDNYHPDHLYFDGAVPFQGEDRAKTGLEVIAHLYNHSMEVHGGNQEAVMCIKRISDHGYYFDGIATLDFEWSRAPWVSIHPWQTDTSIGPWGYYTGAKYRPVTEIIHELVDIVSKNGNLLLNVPPKADGSLDDETIAFLEAVGRWMGVNGEAIYGAVPWIRCEQGFLRFTKKASSIYVIALKWPEDNIIKVTSMGEGHRIGKVVDVKLLGHGAPIGWKQEERELVINLPTEKPCEHAYAFRVTLSE